MNSKIFIVLVLFVVWEASAVNARRFRDEDDDDDSSSSTSTEGHSTTIRYKLAENFPSDRTDRPKGFERLSLRDAMPSSQNISPAILQQGYANPYLLNGQSGLVNPGLYQGAGLGLGGLQNPYLGGGAGLGGLGGLQNQLLLQQGGFQQGLGGLGGDIYSQQALGGANLYNPYLGGGGLGGLSGLGGVGGLGGAGGLGGIGGFGGAGGLGGIGGINPYLLGRTGYAGAGSVGNYLAQSLLSPYTSYNQLNPYSTYPFSARFGVGRGSSRINNSGSSSNNNDDQ